jgi:4-aminobutyrate aminotransferase-like enzyme
MDLEREYLLQNYARYPLVLRRGKGPYVYDLQGKRYLDFIAGIGVNALGHAHPRIVKLIRQQAATLIHCSNLYYHEYQGALAKKLAEVPDSDVFCNSGTEAMEGALKMVQRMATKIAPKDRDPDGNSFHGRTLGVISPGLKVPTKDFEAAAAGVGAAPRRYRPFSKMPAVSGGPQASSSGMDQGEVVFPISRQYARKAANSGPPPALLVFDGSMRCRPARTISYQPISPSCCPDGVMVAA